MRNSRPLAIFTLIVTLAADAAVAQEPHIVDSATIEAQLAARAAEADEQRAIITRLLEREQVRSIAERAGVDIVTVQSAVSTLDGEELAQIASIAQTVDDSLAGGQSTITISTTTIIIGLLLLILIIVAV